MAFDVGRGLDILREYSVSRLPKLSYGHSPISNWDLSVILGKC